jgi:hypothetical protein
MKAIVWDGWFGRMLIVQGAIYRVHNPQGFTIWQGGDGVKSGVVYGETNEFGYYP